MAIMSLLIMTLCVSGYQWQAPELQSGEHEKNIPVALSSDWFLSGLYDCPFDRNYSFLICCSVGSHYTAGGSDI